MASATPTSGQRKYVEYDEYIDFQLNKTQSNVKATDILTATAGVGVLVLAYLLVFVLFDHWVIEGGFSTLCRWVMLGVLFVACVAWVVWRIVIPYRRRVSGLYAARVIETTEPGLKATLLNLVDLKRAGRPIPDDIKRTLEKRAAVTLAKTDVDSAVDRRPLLQLSYLLLALVVAWCLYTLFSPKRISASVWRALFPASQTAVDTSVKIDRVAVEDAEGRRQDPNVIVAMRSKPTVLVDLQYNGDPPEEVALYYTTADERFKDRRVVMKHDPEVKKRYRIQLRGEYGQGILQEQTYRIVAGDAQAGPFIIRVVRPPTATVQSIHYDYPEYMGLDPRTQDGGHIETWEGTTVTVNAQTDQPVRDAWLVFTETENTAKPLGRVKMRITDGTRLSAELKREISLCNGSHPQFYHIKCVGKNGYEDPQPAVYGVTIRPDRKPDIVLLDPQGLDIDVPANTEIFPLLYQARDRDFNIRFVTLRMKIKRDDDQNDQPEEFNDPVFNGNRKIVRETFDWPLHFRQLEPGDTVEFWLEAQDNMPPRSLRSPWCQNGVADDNDQLNRTQTRRVTLRIVEPVSKQEAQRKLEEHRRRQQQKQQQHQQQNPKPNDGDRKPGKQPQDQHDGAKGKQDGEKKPQEDGKQAQQNAGDKNGSQQGDRKDGDPHGAGTQNNQNNARPSADNRQGEKPPEDDDERLQRLLREQRQKQQQQKQNQQNGDTTDGKTDSDLNTKNKKNEPQDKTDRKKSAGSDQTPDRAPDQPKTEQPKNEQPKTEQSPQDQSKQDKAKKQKPQDGGQNDGMSDSADAAPKKNDDQTPHDDAKKKLGNQTDQSTGQKTGDKQQTRDKNAADKKSGMTGASGDDTANDADGKQGPTGDATNGEKNGKKKKKSAGGTTGDMPKQPKSKPPGMKPEKPGNGDKKTDDEDKAKPKSISDEPDAGKKKRVNDDGSPAKKQPATGDETGTAEPNNDPDAKPTPSNKPDELKRKDGTNPATKQRPDNKSGTPKTGKKADNNTGKNEPHPSGKTGSKKPDTKKNTSPDGSASPKSKDSSDSNTPNKHNTPDKQSPAGTKNKKQPGPQSDAKPSTNQPDGGASGMKKSQDGNPAGQPNAEKTGNDTDSTAKPEGGQKGMSKNGAGKNQGGTPSAKKDGTSGKAGGAKSKKNGGTSGQSSQPGQGGQDGNQPGQGGNVPGDAKPPAGKQSKRKGPGGGGNQPGSGQPNPVPDSPKPEQSDLEYGKKAANLVLNRLEDQLKRGALSEEELKKRGFNSREEALDYIKRSRDRYNNPQDSQTVEFLKSLKYMKYQSQLKKRTGKSVPDKALPGVGTEGSDDIPRHLRRYYKAFRESVNN